MQYCSPVVSRIFLDCRRRRRHRILICVLDPARLDCTQCRTRTEGSSKH